MPHKHLTKTPLRHLPLLVLVLVGGCGQMGPLQPAPQSQQAAISAGSGT